MKKIYAIYFLVFSISFFAQNQLKSKLDLLKIKLRKEVKVDSIIKINNQIAIELKNNSSVDDAIKLLHKNIKLGKKNNKEIGIVSSYLTLTNIYMYASVLDSASYYNSIAIEISKKSNNKNKLAKAYTQKSIIYQSQSDYKNQLKYNLLSLEIAKEINDFLLLSENYNNLSMYFLDQNRYKDALDAAKKSNKFAKLTNNEQLITNSYTGIAESYSLLKDTINAEINFKKGINLSKKITMNLH